MHTQIQAYRSGIDEGKSGDKVSPLRRATVGIQGDGMGLLKSAGLIVVSCRLVTFLTSFWPWVFRVTPVMNSLCLQDHTRGLSACFCSTGVLGSKMTIWADRSGTVHWQSLDLGLGLGSGLRLRPCFLAFVDHLHAHLVSACNSWGARTRWGRIDCDLERSQGPYTSRAITSHISTARPHRFHSTRPEMDGPAQGRKDESRDEVGETAEQTRENLLVVSVPTETPGKLQCRGLEGFESGPS